MNELLHKLYLENVEKTIAKKGYSYFTKGDYNLNIIGVRKENKNNVITNDFDDILVVTYYIGGYVRLHYFDITTEPGIFYTKEELLNSKGTAILVPGQYKGAYKIGKHNNKYDALVQVKPVKVYRDDNKDDIYDLNPETIDEGYFGINIHRSNPYVSSNKVDKWSAGCQVFKNPLCFNQFIKLCREQAKRFGNSFTYTLLDEKDFD